MNILAGFFIIKKVYLMVSTIKMSAYLAKNQQYYFKTVLSELERRSDKGEQDPCIAYNNRVPFLAKNLTTNVS